MTERIETMRAVWPGSTVRRTRAGERCGHPLPPSPDLSRSGIDAATQPEETPTCARGARERNVGEAGRATHGFKS
jgi:hypothetical protein